MGNKIEKDAPPPWLRWVLVLLAGVVGIVGIGLFHGKFVEPQQEVWNKDKPVHWGVVPVTVGTNVREYQRPLGMAIERINIQVGCELFALSETPMVQVIQSTIQIGEESEDWFAGTWVSKDATRGEIRVFRPMMVTTDIWVLWHELGHVVGLAHDRSHVMKRITKESIGGKLQIPRFQDKDALALGERYCQRD